MPDLIQAGGNAEVIRLLEWCLNAAKENPTIGHVTVAYLFQNPDVDGKPRSGGGWAGDALLDPRADRLLQAMAAETRERIINRTMPPRDEGVPADYVIYNVPNGSISYDFIIWLMDCEMQRAREGDAPPLKVHFWFGRDGKTGLYSDAQKQMFEKVIRPSLALIGAIEHQDAIHGRDLARRHFREIVRTSSEGDKVPLIKAPYKAREAMKEWLAAHERQNRAPITITLREAEHWPHRNSNLAAWLRFAADLQSAGERVIFVRDTAKANEPIDDFEFCPPASTDLHMRVALYEQAKVNLFVANGPSVLAHFMDRPWLTFVPIEEEESPYLANRPSFWRMHVGIDVGEQYPWSQPDQRLVWKRDDYKTIAEAWQALSGTLRDEPAPHNFRDHKRPERSGAPNGQAPAGM